jgi:hypothetical protein
MPVRLILPCRYIVASVAPKSASITVVAIISLVFIVLCLSYLWPNEIGLENSRVFIKRGLTPELTGAGGPIGPQGTNMGHQNRAAMANVGVRVERFVRLGLGDTVLHFKCISACVHTLTDAKEGGVGKT